MTTTAPNPESVAKALGVARAMLACMYAPEKPPPTDPYRQPLVWTPDTLADPVTGALSHPGMLRAELPQQDPAEGWSLDLDWGMWIFLCPNCCGVVTGWRIVSPEQPSDQWGARWVGDEIPIIRRT